MHPFYLALLMLLPLALSAPDKPRRSAEERLDAVESLARHALARLDDLEERVTKMEQPTTAMKDEITAVKTVIATHAGILTEHSRLFTNYSEELRAAPEQPDDSPATGASRRLQAAPNNTGKVVHIHKATVSIPEGPGWGMSPNYNGGHRRRSLQSGGQCGNMATRAQQVQARCCDEVTEDCSGGYPRTCNAGCAAVFLPFWAECGSLLDNSAVYQPVVAMCQTAASGTDPGTSPDGSTVHQFSLVCNPGQVNNCIPACDEHVRGDLLLLNLRGDDHKFSCERQHGIHSWIAPSADGGYLGNDFQAFFSAVMSGASGLYISTLRSNAGITTDLTIRSGQDVKIFGDSSLSVAPVWGTGGFTISERGSIMLARVSLAGRVMFRPGATSLSFSRCILQPSVFPLPVTISGNTTVTIDNATLIGGASLAAISRRKAGSLSTGSSFEYIGAAWATSHVAFFLLPKMTFSRGQHQRYASVCAAAGLHPVISGSAVTSCVTTDHHPVYGTTSALDLCTQYGCLPSGAPGENTYFGSDTCTGGTSCASGDGDRTNDFCSFMRDTGWSDLVAFSPYGPHDTIGRNWNQCCTHRGCSQGTPACTAGSIMNSVGSSRPSGVCCNSGCSLAEGCVNQAHVNNGWTADPTKGWRDRQFHPVCVRQL
eukprot:COSAG01_NODE_44_length_32259_cov_19.234297_1_plen_654_part_00